ncbi:MAG: hypothetical protein HQ581_18655 [Planctomycetes bacterium]|nr:hypothetical protein [Planctomycetota bacterium]
MAALFPRNKVLAIKGWECHANPEKQLAQQPKKQRIEKRISDYEARKSEFRTAWPRVRGKLTEANRFSVDLLAAIDSLS